MRRKPNLFIIGAAKSGTTSLHDYLSAHSEIFMSNPKEPGFFVPELEYYPRDEDWYLGLFAGAEHERFLGESSTHYTKLPVYPGVPSRMAGYLEESPRLIYIMRDPVERTISHYWHNMRRHEEYRPIGEALRNEVSYVAYSDYKAQLEPFFAVFGDDTIYTLTFEELIGQPDRTLSSLLEWLGVGAMSEAASLKKKNVRPECIQKVRGRGRLERFAHTKLWNRLSPLTPKWIKDIAKSWSVEEVQADTRPSADIIEELRATMQPQVLRLSVFLGREFPEWTTTLEGG